jgi:hypothetical protein
MNHEFDRRWKIAASTVRTVDQSESCLAAPPGFATRVVAQWRSRPAQPSLAVLWQTLTLRTLGLMATVLFVLTGFVLLTEPSQPTLAPPIAESVGEQLPWFEQ